MSFSRFGRMIISVVLPLSLLLSIGCQTTSLAGESKLAGAWALVEGTKRIAAQGQEAEQKLSSRDNDQPYLVIHPDGSFYTILRSGFAQLERLRNRGDRVELENAGGTTVEVEGSHYTSTLSELHLRFHNTEQNESHTMSFEARLLPDGRISYRHVLPYVGLGEEEVTAILKRIENRRPWAPPGLVREFRGHRAGVSCVEFSPDGRRILSGGWDKSVFLWDVDTGKQIQRMKGHETRIADVAFSPDGRLAVSGSYEALQSKPADPYSVRIWGLETGRELLKIEGYKYVTSVDFSPNGRLVLASGYPSWEPHQAREWMTRGRPTVSLWSAETGELLTELRQRQTVMSAVFLPDGQSVLCTTGRILRGLSREDKAKVEESSGIKTLDVDGMLCLYDAEEGGLLRCFGQPASRNSSIGLKMLSLSPDEKRVLTVGQESFVQEWDFESGEELHRMKIGTAYVSRAIYLPDGRRILVGNNRGAILVWDMEANQELRRFEGHRDSVTDLAVAPDGRRAVSCSQDGTVRLWQLPQ